MCSSDLFDTVGCLQVLTLQDRQLTLVVASRAMRLTISRALLALVALLLGLGVIAPAAQAADNGTTIRFTTVLTPGTSISSKIGSTEYGLMLFTGTATWKGESIQVERRLSYRYTKGDGPAGGFLTLIWPDGSTIAMDGGGFTEAGPTHSTIYVAFNSFGVTGRWKGYQGIGRQDCIRHGYVNVPATCTYTISMHKR